MIEKPSSSRSQLEWYRFDEKGSRDWMLNLLPPYYAALFEEQESSLMAKSNTGWRDSKSGKTKFAYFKGLTPAEIEGIKRFIRDYERLVILGLNKNIEQGFTDELDSCIALDYNFESRKHATRTEIGELVYRAKYKGSKGAVQKIVQHLESVIKRIPGRKGGLQSCMSYIPPEPDKSYDLPRELAKLLVMKLEGTQLLRKEIPLVRPALEVNKPIFKELMVGRKITAWEKILSEGRIRLSGSIEGCAVYVIDDLYQSGTTMWSYAKYLKSCGAAAVFGLACVKTLRDTDNK